MTGADYRILVALVDEKIAYLRTESSLGASKETREKAKKALVDLLELRAKVVRRMTTRLHLLTPPKREG